MEIFKIKVVQPGEEKPVVKLIAVGSGGKSPPGVSFILTEAEFQKVSVGQKIGVSGYIYEGLAPETTSTDTPIGHLVYKIFIRFMIVFLLGTICNYLILKK